jgi:hypothetical protein
MTFYMTPITKSKVCFGLVWFVFPIFPGIGIGFVDRMGYSLVVSFASPS